MGLYAFVAGWVSLSLVAGYLAFDQYRSFWKWFAISLVISPILASFLAILLPTEIPIATAQEGDSNSLYIVKIASFQDRLGDRGAFVLALAVSVAAGFLVKYAL